MDAKVDALYLFVTSDYTGGFHKLVVGSRPASNAASTLHFHCRRSPRQCGAEQPGAANLPDANGQSLTFQPDALPRKICRFLLGLDDRGIGSTEPVSLVVLC